MENTAFVPKMACGEAVTDLVGTPHSEYWSVTHYFCCANCKAAFDRDPERFLHVDGCGVDQAAPAD